MGTETSLSKLQKQVTKLEKDNLKLRELLEHQKENNNNLKSQLRYLEKNMEDKIKKALKAATSDLLKENQPLKAENIKLKAMLNNDSSNSGIPTSKTPIGKEKRIPNSRKESQKSKGGQKGHKKHKLERFKDEEITDTYKHELANKTCTCGGKLVITNVIRKDEFDVKVRLIKIKHEFFEYTCPCCNKAVKVPIPNNLKEENQYGSNVQAMALSLLNEGYVSMHRVKELISGFTGNELQMSEGYIF